MDEFPYCGLTQSQWRPLVIEQTWQGTEEKKKSETWIIDFGYVRGLMFTTIFIPPHIRSI